MKRIINTILILLVLFLVGCIRKEERVPVSSDPVNPIVATLLNTKGEEIGEASFTETEQGVKIEILAEHLPPGKHGTHIHEVGLCELPNFETAGGHLNPNKKEHGFDNPKGFHLGDLPNIEVDQFGKVNVALTIDEFTLRPNEKNTLLDTNGSALIIHEDVDDYKTDPSGNSGERIACAAIISQ